MTQQNRPQVGWLSPNPSPDMPLLDEFKQGMRDLSLVEGQDYDLVLPGGGAEPNFLELRASELVKLGVNVMVTSATTATLAAKQATTSIPIVMVAVGDPKRTGILTDLQQPEGNITGLATLLPQSSARRLELLKGALPTISRVAVVLNPDNPANEFDWLDTQAASARLGVDLYRLEVRTPLDFEPRFKDAQEWGPDALLVFVAPLMIVYRRTIVGLAAQYTWPAMYGLPEFVDEGGLMAYGPCFPEMYRRAAVFVRAILFEKKTPTDLPVDQPSEFDLTFNRDAANALNAVIPSILRFRFRVGAMIP